MENLEKYFKLYDEKKYKNYFYTYTYNDIIEQFVEFHIYMVDDYRHLVNRNIINNEYKKIILEIADIKQKKKLLPLTLFLGEDFYIQLLENHYFEDMKEFVFDELKQLNLKIDLNRLDKFSYDYEYLSSTNTQLDSNDFHTIYNFSLDASMLNYQYANFSYNFSLKYDFNIYCSILDTKDLFTFLSFVINLDTNKQESIRKKVLTQKSNINLLILKNSLDNQNIIKDIIFDYSIDLDNWERFIKFVFKYLNNENIFISLAQVISQLEIDKVNIINKYIKCDKNIDKFFFNIENENYQKLIAFQLYKKWKNYIRQNKSIIDMTLTPLINIIVAYIQQNINDKNRKRMIDRILHILNNIDNIWFVNNSKQLEYQYYLLTKLFVYSYQFEYKENEIKNILNKYPNLEKRNNIDNLSIIKAFDKSFNKGSL